MKQQLQKIIKEIEKEIQKDINNGTSIPEWYNEIKNLLERTKQELRNNNIEKALELMGDINLDLLEQVDEFDGLIGELIEKLQRLKEKYLQNGQNIPKELQKKLEMIHKTIDKYI